MNVAAWCLWSEWDLKDLCDGHLVVLSAVTRPTHVPWLLLDTTTKKTSADSTQFYRLPFIVTDLRMEKAVEVLLPPQPDVVTSPPAAAPAEDTPLPKAAGAVDPMEEFGRRLQDIISAHGSAADAQVTERAR